MGLASWSGSGCLLSSPPPFGPPAQLATGRLLIPTRPDGRFCTCWLSYPTVPANCNWGQRLRRASAEAPELAPPKLGSAHPIPLGRAVGNQGAENADRVRRRWIADASSSVGHPGVCGARAVEAAAIASAPAGGRWSSRRAPKQCNRHDLRWIVWAWAPGCRSAHRSNHGELVPSAVSVVVQQGAGHLVAKKSLHRVSGRESSESFEWSVCAKSILRPESL